MRQLDLPVASGIPHLSRVGIQSRRYLGAKTRLLDFLEEKVAQRCGRFRSFVDIFGGTGVVADRFNSKKVKVIANDILTSNVVPMRCFLETSGLDTARLGEMIATLNALEASNDNYVSQHFGGAYFTIPDARRIGEIREAIASWRESGRISEMEENVLLTSLLYSMDRVANTCGHYDAYREKLDNMAKFELALPIITQDSNNGNQVFQRDANELLREISADVIYIDPPYNSRQYSDTYHLLENIARWQKPEVFGKARKMDRHGLKSRYNSSRHATVAFRDLIAHARCRYLVISYNNMAKKGDPRSNACIPDEVILEALGARGTVSIFERPFVHFSAGLRSIEKHRERLFFCAVRR